MSSGKKRASKPQPHKDSTPGFQSWQETKTFFRYQCINPSCPNQGKREPEIELVEDYIKPRSKTREHNHWDNVQPLCPTCKAEKGTKRLDYRAQFRRERIVDHIGRYRLSFRPVINRIIYQDNDCKNDLEELLPGKQNRIWLDPENKISGYSFYQLTKSEARKRYKGNTYRAAPISNPSARVDLIAELCFCCMGEQRRERLEKEELQRFFGDDIRTTRSHCIEGGYIDQSGRAQPTRIYQILVRNVENDNIIRELEALYREHRELPKVGQWIANRRYSFAVLVFGEQKTKDLRAQLRQTTLESGEPLTRAVHIKVESVPDAYNLKSIFR